MSRTTISSSTTVIRVRRPRRHNRWHEVQCGADRSHRRTDRSVDCDERSFTGSAADVDIPAAAPRDGTSRENAVACELSESVQPRNVDSLRVGDGYGCATHDIQHARCCDPVVAAWTSVGWLLHGSGSCGVLGWSECAWRTGCERTVFLSARNRRNVVNAEDGYFEIAVSDQSEAGFSGFRDWQD